MPIYEYQCEKCCHCFEILLLSSDDKETSCPECGHSRTKRLMSSSCFIGSSGSNSCGNGPSKGFT